MKRNVMRKNIRQTIRKSLGRYIAIVAIIALGAGMFVGLLTTKMDMVATAQKYTDDTNMFDLRLLSTYGWTAEDVDAVAEMSGIVDAEGAITVDVIATQDKEDKEAVYRLHSIPKHVNKVHLLGGRMPKSPDECLVDGNHVDDSVLGKKFVISEGNEADTLSSISQRTFTVVGYVSTPLYMDMSRGNTTLGNGNLADYLYIPLDAFSVDYFTEIAVTIAGDYDIYTDAFTKAMEKMAEKMDPGVTILAQARYLKLKDDAQAEFDKGWKEYEDGAAEFQQGKQEAMDKLADALKELEDGQAELDSGWATLLDGEKQLQEAQATLDANMAKLNQSRQELANARAEAYTQMAQARSELMEKYKEVTLGLEELRSGLAQIDDGILQLEDGLTQLEEGIGQLDLLIGLLEISVEATRTSLEIAQKTPGVDAGLISRLEANLAEQTKNLTDYTQQRQELVQMQTDYTGQLEELKTKKAELTATKAELESAITQIDLGLKELDSSRIQAEDQFAAAEAQLDAGMLQLEAGQMELDAKKAETAAGRAELEQAQITLDEGWAEYEQGRLEAEAELAEAEGKLLEAKEKLDEAKITMDSMAEPEVYILDRNTNVGYLAVDSNSDIVAGVSRVFPAFFLLVAALVCITTMTRMVDEERTQIGILKALGYGNGAIIRKYLVYSGSAAVVGCGLGVLIGSVAFPKILWAAYSIILNLTPQVVLKLNWPLCIAVVAAYTMVSLLVTWYCCRRELREEPAELIRPRAPTAGKKIWMEYLPFWKRISFLNKVMFRNVFRYRQRFLMMLVGIGGCTALLLTGFGFRDSIMDVVDQQFAEVTTYDMAVYFSEGKTMEQQMQFWDELRDDVDGIQFVHQASADLEHEDSTRSIYLLASDEGLEDYMDLHRGKNSLGMPDVGEAYLSVGVAEAMGIKAGDEVTIRTADMRTLTVEITGIYDNHVNNYAIVRPETIWDQWGAMPEYQMALITVDGNQDVHVAGAKIGAMEGVMNVSISQDLADQVGSMLDALDLVVVTIVVCAGLLAAIVLYNLTNISITERVREIATIKVLGFHARESAAYVFKENLFLTALGSMVGLVGGIFLLKFVMSQIKIDMVWFTARLTPLSFVWAVVLTMLSACIVDFLLYFKLEKINMAEALKSVE